MKNKVQEGKTLDYTNTTGAAILGGAVVTFGILTGIAVADIAVGAVGAVELSGVFELPKATGALAQGVKAYWDSTAGNITATVGSNVLIGAVAEAEISGALTVKVLLTN